MQEDGIAVNAATQLHRSKMVVQNGLVLFMANKTKCAMSGVREKR